MSFERKILIVEDDALLRELLATQLTEWGFSVAVASTPVEATQLCKKIDPDAVLLDVDLGSGPNGFQLAEALGRQMPHLAVVFLTRFPDARASISRMSPTLRNAAYVSKNAIEHADELLYAINATLNDAGKKVKRVITSDHPIATLTKRQLEVLRLLHEGKTNSQIAQERNRSVSSVENMIGRIFKALGIDGNASNSRATAVRMYAETYGYTSR